jgi:15-cis-phytoene synthase
MAEESAGMMELADPESGLALAYAPREHRAALALLWGLDERLGAVLRAARDPMIRAIRLAWWREALEALDHRAGPGEPLLDAIAARLLPAGLSGKALAGIEEGWAALAEDIPDMEALSHHAALRGGRLFALSAQLLGAGTADVRSAGEGWALIDIMPALDQAEREGARLMARERLGGGGARWPRALRPLAVLSALARHDAMAPPGTERRPGSPARVARAMKTGILGH